MAKKAFLIDGSGGPLRPMVEQAYESDDVLQALLAQYPDLLAGEEMDPNNPRRWSLDHLFLYQGGVPLAGDDGHLNLHVLGPQVVEG